MTARQEPGTQGNANTAAGNAVMASRSGKSSRRRPRVPDAVSSARMPQWQLRAIYGATAALVASGIIWLLLHYFGQTQGEFGLGPNPFEHSLLAVHGAAAMAFLIVLGSLLPVHVIRGWNQQRNLASGFTLAGVNAVLIVTGYGLYYFGGDRLRAFLSLSHWLIGLTIAALLTWHIVVGRSGRRR